MKISESQLKNIINEEIQKAISEAKYKKISEIVKKCISEAINDQNYTHFAILKQNGKIVNGWDYSDYDPADLRSDKKYYFTQDIIDYGFNPKDIKILTKKACIKQGINPDDDSCWTNGIEFRNESINKNINEMYEEGYQFDETFDDEEETYSEGAINFYDFANICNQNGWDYHDYMEVSNGEQSGYRYVFRGNGNCSFEDLITQLKQAANNPDGIIPGTASNKNAPEQKYYTIVVLD